ncbi:MAG: Hsp20/alpha crystallin family protein [Rhizobiaceae bacterium]
MVEKSHSAGWIPEFYEPFRNIGQKIADWFAPASDASASGDSYEINIELPGVKPEDVEVTINDNSLKVTGHKHAEREESGRSYYFSERQYGAFQRTFRLPPDFDGENITASFADGVLQLSVGKQKELQPSEKKIKITSN